MPCSGIKKWRLLLLCVAAWLSVHVAYTGDRLRAVADFTVAELPQEGGKSIALPDVWDKSSRSGERTYLVRFELDDLRDRPMAIYIPRLGNRYKLHANGSLVAQAGNFGDPVTDFVQHPQYVVFPENSLQSGTNTLTVTVEGEANRYAGLSRFRIGPDRALRSEFTLRRSAQVGGSMVIVVMCAMFAVFGIAMYAGLRQTSDLFFAVSCAFCSVRTSNLVLEAVPFDRLWWAWTVDLCYAGLVSAIVMFCVRTLEMNRRLWMALTVVFILTSLAMVSFHVFGVKPGVRKVWLFLMLAYVSVVSLAVIARWWAIKTKRAAVLAIAAAGGLLIGVHDHWLVYYSRDGYGGFALARFALVLFILAMGWIIIDRLVSRVREEREMRESVAKELSQKKQELADQYAREARLVEEQAQVREREKLVQDLHDGMGLQLNSLLGMVERQDADPKELQQEVRLSIEQLRTLVDGAERFDGSLAELLGQIRYRVDTRLRRQGVSLLWRSELGDSAEHPVDQLAALNLQHLLYELATNVIKHSTAKSVTVEWRLDAGAGGKSSELQIRFVDDGLSRAINSGPKGGGQRSIERRVNELGGLHELLVLPAGGWEHRLAFPLSAMLHSSLPQSK